MKLSKAEIKYLRSLSQKKYRDEEQKFVLEGWKPLRDALAARAPIEFIAIVSQSALVAEHRAIVSDAAAQGIAVRELTELELHQITDTVHSQGVIALVRQLNAQLSEFLEGEETLLVACDELNDPGNLGSIVRTCDWFGVDGMLLSAGSVSLYNEKVVRATAGSIFHLPVVEGCDLLNDLAHLRQADYTIVATAMDGETSVTDLRSIEKLVLVLGSEAHGIRTELRAMADHVAAIPKFGQAESLNVGVACGIILAGIRGNSKE